MISTVYYRTIAGKKHLIYVEVSGVDIDNMMETSTKVLRLHDNNSRTVHLCLSSDKKFSDYVYSRQCIPNLEILFNNIRDLEDYCIDKFNLLV